MNTDPTKQEMINFLVKIADGEDSTFDIEEAIYWFASDYHSGQWSNLYSALSTSPYSPGPCCTGPEDEFLYAELVAEYATKQEMINFNEGSEK